MTVTKISWRSFIPCIEVDYTTETGKAKAKAKATPKVAAKQSSFKRMLQVDLSNPSSTLSEDISISLLGSNIHMFTYGELKVMTQNFSTSNFIGEGGFGPVHKGFIDDKLRPGLKAQPVAVKFLDLDGSQGHREWLTEVIFLGQLRHPHLVKLIGYSCEDEHRVLVYEYMPRGSLENQLFRRYSVSLPWSTRMKIALGAAKGLAFLHEAEKPVIYRDFKASNILLDSDYNSKLSDFGLAKDGPDGDDTHVSTRVMGTEGYAAPEYIMTGHLTAMSDVYSFGVVLLELLTGRRSLERNRPHREQNLVEYARPMLNDHRKLSRIMDPRLEDQYSETGARKAAALAYQCLSHRPKQRPTMSEVVKTLEPLKDYQDLPIGTFVFTVPTESPDQTVKGNETPKEHHRRENGHQNGHRQSHHRYHKSPNSLSENGLRNGQRKTPTSSPLHHRSRAA